MLLGFGLAALHELAHAVALVHYGRTPRSAGCGFYWGALCFYVDSSDGTTLPRRARIVNALAGLAVDLVTTSILLLVSHGFAASVLVMSVCWRLAILQLIGIVENGLPILEVDGHVALADYLDEPDLAPRPREALSRRLRGVHHRERPSWLAVRRAQPRRRDHLVGDEHLGVVAGRRRHDQGAFSAATPLLRVRVRSWCDG
jgi:hypothetical protein